MAALLHSTSGILDGITWLAPSRVGVDVHPKTYTLRSVPSLAGAYAAFDSGEDDRGETVIIRCLFRITHGEDSRQLICAR